MTATSTFRISSAAAPYVGADKPRQDRLKAAAGLVALPGADLVLLVYYLCHDPDPEVKRTAMETMRALDLPFLLELLADRELHPRILDVLVQLHHKKPELASLLCAHPMLSARAASFLAGQGAVAPAAVDGSAQGAEEIPSGAADDTPLEDDAADLDHAADMDDGKGDEVSGELAGAASADESPVDEQSEEFQSKYQLAQAMGIGDKIKTALTGDKEWRGILIKDSNKLVSGAVIRNPRITEGEVLTISKSAVQNDEIMRVICANKEWLKNPLIRKALVENSKTPLPVALRLVATLSEKNLSILAKSKNVSSVVASQARRILLTKKKDK